LNFMEVRAVSDGLSDFGALCPGREQIKSVAYRIAPSGP